MISRYRMKIDSIGQSILLMVALVFLYFQESSYSWTNTFIILLGIWQVVSAIHLYYAYKYVKRKQFFKMVLVVLVSLPIWIKLVGIYAYIPVFGLLFWYFYQTLKDTRTVYNRPRSFWELG